MTSSVETIRFILDMAAAMIDIYKYGHPEQLEEAEVMEAYGECRGPLTDTDGRIVYSGMRYIVERYLEHRWTTEEVDLLAEFMSTANAGNTPYPWPEQLFRRFVADNGGYIPITIFSLPEGSVVQPHTPLFTMRAAYPYARLVTIMETVLTKVWYPTTVATVSRHIWQDVRGAYDISVDDEDYWTLDFRLHDFGMRGCTCEEQAMLGGMAHLLNFRGSDTTTAMMAAQFAYNNRKPVGQSIPATEHSVMTARGRDGELSVVKDMIAKYGKGVFATVGDSYDWENFLENIVPACVEQMQAQGGLWVVRPDSGDPVTCVLQALECGAKNFGYRINKKGYKVINHFAVIQSDGINAATYRKILNAAMAQGFSAQNVAGGMGAGHLQKLNRDTLRFATKLCYRMTSDGEEIEVMKDPKTDPKKRSLPGLLSVRRTGTPQTYTVVPKVPKWHDRDIFGTEEQLKVVYDCGPVAVAWPTFDQLRNRVTAEWLLSLPTYDPRSHQLLEKSEALSRVGCAA